MDFLNKKNNGKRQLVRRPMDLLILWVNDEFLGNNNINIDNPEIVMERKKGNYSMRNTNTKKLTGNPSMIIDKEMDHLVRNTLNSQINAFQFEELKLGDIDAARKRNMDYVLRKVKYEVNLIRFQINKYEK